MPEEMSQIERSARQFLADMRALAPEIAAHKVPAPGARKVSRMSEREVYWTRDPNVDPQSLWNDVLTAADQIGMPHDEAIQRALPNVAMAIYPHRQKLIQSGERTMDVKAQIAYDRRMAAAGPPEGMGLDG